MTVLPSQPILIVLFLIVVPAVAGPLLTRWADREAKRRGVGPPSVRALRLVLTLGWVVVVAVGLYLTVGPISLLSSLTVSAIAGITVTLALQTTLQNIVAGYLLLRRRFLRLGDHVVISSVQGQVVSVGLITTVMKM